MATRAAVIGAGPIGCATAGHLARRGLEVTLCDADPDALAPVARTGRITLTGALSGEAPVVRVTTDPAEAAQDAELVILCVPASAHESVARTMAPRLRPGAVLLIQPGQTLSAVACRQAALAAGLDLQATPVTFVESLSTVFTARLARPGVVEVHAVKRFVGFAALPASATHAVAPLLTSLFDRLTPCSSVLEVGLHNANAVVHPAVTLCNAGSVDMGRDFLFYREGATRAVIALAEAVERERLALLDDLAIPRFTLLEWYDRVYGVNRPTLYEAIRDTVPYHTIPSPSSLQTRLLTEDIPTGLVPQCSLARAAGVDAPVMRSLVDIAGALLQKDFWASGRTLERLGLGHLDREGLLRELGPAR